MYGADIKHWHANILFMSSVKAIHDIMYGMEKFNHHDDFFKYFFLSGHWRPCTLIRWRHESPMSGGFLYCCWYFWLFWDCMWLRNFRCRMNSLSPRESRCSLDMSKLSYGSWTSSSIGAYLCLNWRSSSSVKKWKGFWFCEGRGFICPCVCRLFKERLMLAQVGGVRVLHLHRVFVGGVFVFGYE